MSRTGGIPPFKCTARAKSTGDLCKNWAIPGAVVCKLHGARTKTTAAKADLRMTLADLLRGEPRPPWQVLLDALHTSDAIMQDVIEVAKQHDLTPDQLDRLVLASERAAKLSKMTLDANVGERRTRLLESQTQIMAGAVQAGLDAVFAGLTAKLGLSPQDEVELRQAALEAAASHAEAQDSSAARGWGNDERGNQRFLRQAGYVRKELPPVSTGEDSDDQATPKLTPDEIAQAQRRYAERQAGQHPARHPHPKPGVPDLRVVPPEPPPSPLE